MTKFRLLIKRSGKMELYKSYPTLEEATKEMSRLNGLYLNKAWKRASRKGHAQIGHSAYYDALSKTAIQY